MPNFPYPPEEDEDDVEKLVDDNTGGKVRVTYHRDGSSTVHWGGPCGDQEFDRDGNS